MDLFKDGLFRAWEITAQSIIAGVAITAAVRIAIALLSARLNAATRYTVWFVTLLVIAALPLALSVSKEQVQLAAPSYRTQPVTTASVPSVGNTVEPEPMPAVAPIEVPLSIDAAVVFTLAWLGIVSLLGIRLLWSYRSIRKLKSTSSAAPPEAISRVQQLLQQWPSVRVPALLASPDVRSPMAVGYSSPAVVVPESLMLRLHAHEFDAVALHEIAHVRRYDDWTRLVQCVLRALWFFHPAIHYICRQLDFERELACDDAVLSLTGAPKSYASSLTSMLDQTPRRHCHPVLASGAAFERNQIVRRVRAILDRSRNAAPRISPLGLVVLLMCLAGFSASFVDLPDLFSFIEDASGPVHRVKWNSNGQTVWMESRGNVELGDDEHLLDVIAPGSSIKFGEGTWSRRAIEYRRDASGAMVTRYTENGRERPVDASVQRWANELLLKIIRTTGLDAENRALRLLSAGGTAAVFRELEWLGSDDNRGRYLNALLESGDLTDEDISRTLSRASRMKADHAKVEVLLKAIEVTRTAPLRLAIIDATRTVRASHERKRVVTELAKLPETMQDATMRVSFLRAVDTMDASHEQAEVLIALLRTASLPAEALSDIAHVTATIESDHDRSRVLSELSSGELPEAAAGSIARSAARMQSDNDKANVLVRLANLPPSTAFVSAVRSIQSDADRRRVLDAMIERSSSSASVRSAAELAATLDSDGDKAQVLMAIAARRTLDPEVSEAVRRSAAKIASADEYRAVIRAVEQQ